MNIHDTNNHNNLLKSAVKSFMEKELLPYEEKIDKLGFVPDEIGSQIQEKSKEMGLYSANLPKKFGGGGHKKAAGFTLKGKMVIDDIFDEDK